MTTKEALLKHSNTYSRLRPEDIFKFLYQSVFGCEHMIADSGAVTEFIKKEASDEENCLNESVEPLDGDYSRLHLGYLKKGLKPETLGRLFYLSAGCNKGTQELLLKKLSEAKELALDGAFSFSFEDFISALEDWERKGYSPIHHSAEFRKAYKPAYRVISNKYVPLLPLLTGIDTLSEKERVILAVEGGSASGKTTLAALLGEIYDCNLFHADDFFLQPHQRTAERLNEPGGNLDRERLLSEILIPLSKGKTVEYRKYDCETGQLLPPRAITPKRINIIEGAYSMHPDLCGYYNISLFLEISPDFQRERIKKRNSPYMAERFFNEWIPLERKYSEHFGIKEKCSFSILSESL